MFHCHLKSCKYIWIPDCGHQTPFLGLDNGAMNFSYRPMHHLEGGKHALGHFCAQALLAHLWCN